MELTIIIILIILTSLMIRYSILAKRRIHNTDIKIDNISDIVNRLCSKRIDAIKMGYNFIQEFQNLYKTYNPYHILVNSFTYNDHIKNFKMTNIIRIKDDLNPFENTIKEYQNIPISDLCIINDMIVNKIKYTIVEYKNENEIDSIIKSNVIDFGLKHSYFFMKYYNDLPVFGCILSFQEQEKLSESELEKISNTLEKINF